MHPSRADTPRERRVPPPTSRTSPPPARDSGEAAGERRALRHAVVAQDDGAPRRQRASCRERIGEAAASSVIKMSAGNGLPAACLRPAAASASVSHRSLDSGAHGPRISRSRPRRPTGRRCRGQSGRRYPPRSRTRRRAAGRDAGEITLIAVCKGHPTSRILPALAAGHATFGENRVQEASEKWQTLRAEWPSAVLHYIGALQTNKARDAVAGRRRRHPRDRPAEAGCSASPARWTRQGEAPGLLHSGQHRRRAAEGRRAAGWPRCAARAVPERT